MTSAMKSGRIERNSPLPLYHQLKQVLFDQNGSGQWKPGELIPGEQELQDTYGLSRTTVRQALRELDPSVRAIVSSGYSTDPAVSDFRSFGFVARVEKPYRIQELGAVLREALHN